MNIVKNLNGSVLEVSISGDVDTATAMAIEENIKESLDGVTDLRIDFAEVDYIASTGLRLLLMLHKKMAEKGGMTIKNVNDEVMEVFKMTGFAGILVIE